MANTIRIPRAHLIMGLCMPLAVLLGYFLAEPMDLGSLAVVLAVLCVLATPLMMKWHHPLLVLGWNACMVPVFLPGATYIWMPLALASFLFAILNRSVRAENRFIYIPSVTRSLLFLVAIVLLTGFMTGGFGLRAFGSAMQGGKGYVYILAAVAGYFALTSERIPAHRAGLYLAMFFLPAISGIIPNLAVAAGRPFYFLFYLFPIANAVDQATAGQSINPTILRINGLTMASVGLACYLFARHGIRGILDFTKPWRGFFFLLAFLGCLACSFRAILILFLVTFAVLFFLEGLHRTRLLPVALVLTFLGAALLIPFAEKLPLPIQRTLSFLPVKVDALVKRSADDSTEWRLMMWQAVLPEIPKYLVKGKGYVKNPYDLYMAYTSQNQFLFSRSDGTLAAGDYHNGVLSVIIPFGLAGVIAFGWFLAASLRYLYRNYRFGDPSLKQVNTFLLAFFIARIVSFVFIFGSFYSDLYIFTGLIGLSASLNGEPEPAPEPEPLAEPLGALSLN